MISFFVCFSILLFVRLLHVIGKQLPESRILKPELCEELAYSRPTGTPLGQVLPPSQISRLPSQISNPETFSVRISRFVVLTYREIN